MVAALVGKYRGQGLVLVAPTQRYGYVSGGRPTSPDRELRHIVQVRDTTYAFMRKESVPVTDANYKQYGVASIPMHVLIDRTGIIRLYRPRKNHGGGTRGGDSKPALMRRSRAFRSEMAPGR